VRNEQRRKRGTARLRRREGEVERWGRRRIWREVR
jgi:hypothetical protein